MLVNSCVAAAVRSGRSRRPLALAASWSVGCVLVVSRIGLACESCEQVDRVGEVARTVAGVGERERFEVVLERAVELGLDVLEARVDLAE